MSITETLAVPPTPKLDRPAAALSDVTVAMVGQAAAWFDLDQDDDGVTLRPREALARRCTIRPAALFRQNRGFYDVNMVMGRLVFERGATQGQRYTPFTLDAERRLCELFLPAEVMPEDDWPVSTTRWSNCQAIAKRLLSAADVAWGGLRATEVDQLVSFVPWPEPLEGCLLHALTQWTHQRGCCVVEIGSFRGRSTSMFALALRGAGSGSKVISIDPHTDEPHNREHVRLALRQLGEEERLVQYTGGSDEAWRILRPRSASLVFVDGAHGYDQVVRDFEHYRDVLAPGGCMIFHDYGYGEHNGRDEADPEVRSAIDEHVLSTDEFRPLLLAHTQFAFVKRAPSSQ